MKFVALRHSVGSGTVVVVGVVAVVVVGVVVTVGAIVVDVLVVEEVVGLGLFFSLHRISSSMSSL